MFGVWGDVAFTAFRAAWSALWPTSKSSAPGAKDRLRSVIAQDRAAVPCGRWVLRNRFLQISIGDGIAWLGINSGLEKFRYRYEVRR